MTEEQELDDWLAENLMEWNKCGRSMCSMWVEPQSGVHRDAEWLTTTGDGMLAVLERMGERWFSWSLNSDWCTIADKRTFAVFSKQKIYAVDRQDSPPLAVGLAAKAALEAKLAVPPQ